MYLFRIFQSSYCRAVFIISLVGSYFLIPPTVFNGFHYIIAITFMVTFSLSMMCIIRSIKDKILLAKTYKGSIVSLIASILGLSAIQVCGVGAPICGASIGLGLISILFPKFFVDFLTEYSVVIIVISIILQIASLYYMRCFSKYTKKPSSILTKCKKNG